MDAAVGLQIIWSAVCAGLAALMLVFSCTQKKKPKAGVKQSQPKQFAKRSREKAEREAAAEEESWKSAPQLYSLESPTSSSSSRKKPQLNCNHRDSWICYMCWSNRLGSSPEKDGSWPKEKMEGCESPPTCKHTDEWICCVCWQEAVNRMEEDKKQGPGHWLFGSSSSSTAASRGLVSAEFTVNVKRDGGGLNPAALEGEENQPQLSLRHLVYAQAANIRAEAEAQKKRAPTSTNQQ